MRWFQQAWPCGNGKSKMKNKIFSAGLLGLYALVSIATSVAPNDGTYETHAYSVASNCSNASMTVGQISVTAGRITSPALTSFLSIGFPTEILSVGSPSSGELAPALTRTCVHTLDTSIPNTTISVYTCTDNGIPSCTINLTHLD